MPLVTQRIGEKRPLTWKLVYITAENVEEAREIGKCLVEERLAACVNILPAMISMFRWEGRIQDATEAVLIAKTREDLADSLIRRVQDVHSYDCPCILVLPVEGGNPAFLDWISSETAAQKAE